jgi:MurNAc alpha-1-phosphate uridylyltransferase
MTKSMPKAMVLAAGLGKRMRPLTDTMPKPMVKVAGKSLIDRTLDWLSAAGVKDAVVNSHYFAEMLEAHLAKRKTPAIQTSREEIVLETGGGVKKALPLLGDKPFFVVNSDVICIDGKTPALHRMMDAWDDKLDALLLLHPRERAIGFSGPGDFFLTPEGRVRWREGNPTAPYVFSGTQLVHPRLFKDALGGVYPIWELSNPTKLPDGTLPRIGGIIHDGDWLHVGSPEELKQAEEWFKARKSA